MYYIFGPGATGKSQLTTLLIVLIAEQSVVTTTLNALSHDKFEIANLTGKKLVLINDTDGHLKDSTLLNGYSGLNVLRGRRMYVQGTVEFRPKGIILAVSNSPLVAHDTGNALLHWKCFTTTTKKFLDFNPE